ncbi:hypothetical protein, partial [Methylobacterium radiotolerans]|uniref:hypothetical protein n=1 Tax=Methylobacterium radiotolerans TaxID=31998 RepID=UPI0015C65529
MVTAERKSGELGKRDERGGEQGGRGGGEGKLVVREGVRRWIDEGREKSGKCEYELRGGRRGKKREKREEK